MYKLATIVLSVVVLFLLAANSRLERRRDDLERKKGAVPPRTAAGPVVEDVPAPTAPLPVPEPSTAAGPAVVPALKAAKDLVAAVGSGAPLVGTTFVIQNGPTDDELGLSNDQKAVIEELRKIRDLQTGRHQEEIQAIEERTEAAIRGVLRPDQLEKYDAPVKVEVVPQVEGANPGFLGVSGGDAEGGGARLGQVFEKSAAAEMGLKVDDVVLEVNGEKLAGYGDLAVKIQANPPGTAVMLRVRRGGTEWTQAVILGKRP